MSSNKKEKISAPEKLFPTTTGTNLSHNFEVREKPVVLKAFNLNPTVKARVEMWGGYECSGTWGPYRPNCCNVELSQDLNSLVLGVTGRYRIFIDDPNQFGYDDVIIVQHPTESHSPVPSNCGCDVTCLDYPISGVKLP